MPEIDRQQDSIVDASVVLTGVSGRSSVDVSPRRSLERLVYPSRLDRNEQCRGRPHCSRGRSTPRSLSPNDPNASAGAESSRSVYSRSSSASCAS